MSLKAFTYFLLRYFRSLGDRPDCHQLFQLLEGIVSKLTISEPVNLMANELNVVVDSVNTSTAVSMGKELSSPPPPAKQNWKSSTAHFPGKCSQNGL